MRNYAPFIAGLLFISPLTMDRAAAETIGAERALELLARSSAVDAKCGVLNAGEREELSAYASRAEISVAEKSAVAVARAAIAKGKAIGSASDCNPEESAHVKAVLRAAREAIHALAKRQAAPKPQLAEKQAVATASLPVIKAEPKAEKPAAKANLSAYERVTEAYYLERRCLFLPKPQTAAFYQATLRNHRIAVSEFGKAAILGAKNAAERRANAQSCNGQGKRRVKAGFAEVAAR